MIKYKGKILTAEQEDHINTITKGNNYAIQAPPGSGKTFLLLALARKMKGYGLSVSFNRLLSIEASKKFNSAVTCKTGHALAYGAVGFKYKKRLKKLTGKHLADVMDIGDWQLYNSPSNKGYLILNIIRKFCYSADTVISWKHLPRLTIMQEANIDLMKEDLVQNANMVFNEMIKEDSDLPITHDVYLKIWALSNPVIKQDYIFFDEYQDSNPVIAQVIKDQKCQKIFVGDQFQQIYCQPAGTMISMAKCRGDKGFPKDKTIEDIQIGDNVITFDDSYIFPTGRSVKAKTELNYDGDLINVVTDSGYLSKYIPRHQCMIRLDWSMKDKHIVYLMRKGNQFRIGKVPYLYKTQHGKFGLSMRCAVEQADAGWILSIQNSSKEATLYETAYQAQFGIPGVCWREQEKHKIDVDYFWDFIGDNSFRGENCLTFFGLLIDMPLWTPGYDSMIGLRSTTITAAANVHTGMLMLVLDNALKKLKHSKRSATIDCWEPINVYKERYKGKIYSLEVTKNHNYFADGLLTHNSWRGAVNALQEEQLAKLYITRSFRFGDGIANVANKIIQSYYPADFAYVPFYGNDNIQSEVFYTPLNNINCIICRTNKGVIAETIKTLAKGDSVHILGGIQPLTYLINSIFQLKLQGYTNHPDLFLFTSFTDLKEYADSPMGGDLKAVLKLIETYGRERLLNILESTIEVAENADVTITTAHKSKGLEWSVVKLANDFKLPGDGTVPTQEETNILYVAASRALHKLDLSECQAAFPQTFQEAIRINKENYQIARQTSSDINEDFRKTIDKHIKDLQKDTSFDEE